MRSLSVIEARTQLAQAEADARKERRTKLIEDLRTVRSELKAKRKTYAQLERKVLEGQAALDSIYSSQMAVIDARGRLQTVRPEIADFLPNDPEVLEWNDNIRILDERLVKLREARSKLPNVQLLRAEAMRTHDAIMQLEWREGNILNELNNSLAKNRVGGVFGLT